MCYKADCPTCSKPTWNGCGKHIETALAGVPVEQRCKCKASTQAEQDSKAKTCCGGH